MKRYTTYKDSGIEWIGEIPEHWEVRKLGNLLSAVSIKNRPDLPLLSITREDGIILRDIDDETTNHNFIPDDLSNYKMIRKGQFGMNKMKAWQGSYGVSRYDGIVSPAYFIFRFSDKVDTSFFHIAIRSRLYVSFFGSASDGVRIGQWDLNKDRMKSIPFIFSPLSEQAAIAEFLDEKTEKIDEAIRIKEREIELLKERRQILIQEVVTGKKVWHPDKEAWLPPTKTKDSGIEWIGEIPEEWEVSNLRYVFKFLNSRRIPLSAVERESRSGSFPYYGASGIIDYIDDYIFSEKTILIAEDGANLLSKSTPLAFVVDGKYWVNNHAHILKPKYEGFQFWAELLSLIDYTAYITGAAQPKLSRDNLGSVKVIIPTKSELENISIYIINLESKISQLITLKEEEIEKLKEYKTVLIDAAVTGKVKVERNACPSALGGAEKKCHTLSEVEGKEAKIRL